MSTTDEFLATALGLPQDQRAALAHELILSLEGPADSGVEQAWLAEVRGRLSEVDRGAAVLEDWGAVRDRIAARLRGL